MKVRGNELLGRKIRMEIPTIIAPAVCVTRSIQQIGRNGESTFDLTSMCRLVVMVLMVMTMETMSTTMRRNRGKEVQSGFEKLGEWMQLPHP